MQEEFELIDWETLPIIFRDLIFTAQNAKSNDFKTKAELAKLLYALESELYKLKRNLKLPDLDNSIQSESVLNSFNRAFDKRHSPDQNFSFHDYFKQNDYQYWLLIFLLKKNNEIREKKLSLYQIINEFIDYYKNESLFLEDIERTGSGSPRYKNNIRFAFNDLKRIGLVRLYDKKHKDSWSLTYIGFFVAASFCLDPVDKEEEPLLRKATRFRESTWYFSINQRIIERIYKCSELGYFQRVVETIRQDSLDLKELEKGHKIFQDYCDYLIHIDEIEAKNKTGYFKNFLDDLEKKHSLQRYMSELSTRFDAQAFFEQLIASLNNS